MKTVKTPLRKGEDFIMQLKKKIATTVLAGAIAFGAVFAAGSTFASASANDNSQTAQAKDRYALPSWLQWVAERFGINTEGKTRKEVRAEVKEKRQSFLTKIAEKLGISTEGKNTVQIRADVKAKIQADKKERIYKVAEKLGISTEGKTLDQIKEEIKQAKQKKKAAETNV
jgi:predicted RNase H-like HicB family nuclease